MRKRREGNPHILRTWQLFEYFVGDPQHAIYCICSIVIFLIRILRSTFYWVILKPNYISKLQFECDPQTNVYFRSQFEGDPQNITLFNVYFEGDPQNNVLFKTIFPR